MSEKFDLDREKNLENRIDPTGKKWEIKKQRGRSFYFVRPNPDREDAVIPKPIAGLWTKVALLESGLDKWIASAWAESDAAAAKAERKAQAAKENKRA